MHDLVIDNCLKKIDKTWQESCYVQERSCQILVKYLHDCGDGDSDGVRLCTTPKPDNIMSKIKNFED